MKVAVIGSRGLCVADLGKYLPEGTTEIVSGGARGVDTSAREYALSHGIKLTEFLPEYDKYGRSAPLKRNITIIEYADLVLAFWDQSSRGTKFVIDNGCTLHVLPQRGQHPYTPNRKGVTPCPLRGLRGDLRRRDTPLTARCPTPCPLWGLWVCPATGGACLVP